MIEYYGYPAWRNPLPPLDELVSTILSQNTNDTNRDRAFEGLRRVFLPGKRCEMQPPEAVKIRCHPARRIGQSEGAPHSECPERDHCGARRVNSRFSWLNYRLTKPGTGCCSLKAWAQKTAAIVQQFSLNQPAFPVDTHVHRVTGRLGLRPPGMNAEKAHPYLADLFPPETYYPVHLNIIRLGREICQARRPKCPDCPLQEFCAYYQEIYPENR